MLYKYIDILHTYSCLYNRNLFVPPKEDNFIKQKYL